MVKVEIDRVEYVEKGDWNSGYMNSGNRNSGYRNSGDWNSGNWNSGDMNSGDWNSGDMNSGYMNGDTPPIRIFEKETDVKLEDIKFPNYFFFDLTRWVPDGSICEGHLETDDYKVAWKKSWDKTDDADRRKTLKLPNFNAKIFLEITGIDIKKELKKV